MDIYIKPEKYNRLNKVKLKSKVYTGTPEEKKALKNTLLKITSDRIESLKNARHDLDHGQRLELFKLIEKRKKLQSKIQDHSNH